MGESSEMDDPAQGELSHYPHTIDNGAGERLTFLGIRSDEQGEYLEARNAVSPGSGPPMHVHHLQEEVLTVERGTMGWQRLGEEEHLARSGESATFVPLRVRDGGHSASRAARRVPDRGVHRPAYRAWAAVHRRSGASEPSSARRRRSDYRFVLICRARRRRLIFVLAPEAAEQTRPAL